MLLSADGCKAGWVVAVSDAWPCKNLPYLYICKDFPALVALTGPRDVLVVDIPIGLPERGEPRRCDIEAKNMLGKDGQDRVFLTPPRGALGAKTAEEFVALIKQLTGKGPGLPVWGIVPKLKEVDSVMLPDLQERVFEFHPELAWLHIAGKTLKSKKQKEGIHERESTLETYVPGLDEIREWRPRAGRAARLDDILDALVGLSVAGHLQSCGTAPRRIPSGDPPRDSRGLRMEIWY